MSQALTGLFGSPPDPQPLTIPDRPKAPTADPESAALLGILGRRRAGRDSLVIPNPSIRPAESGGLGGIRITPPT